MPQRTNLYTPIATDLPEIFRRGPINNPPVMREYRSEEAGPTDADISVSWNQVCDYLGLFDAQFREYLNQLIELPALLSPLAARMLPPGLAIDGDPLAIQQARNEILDRLALRQGCHFPATEAWALKQEATESSRQHNQEMLDRKAELIRRLPSLWRSRHTPIGFVKCFCSFFPLDMKNQDQCPILLEHFQYRPKQESADHFACNKLQPRPYAHQFMLLIPQLSVFCQYPTAQEVARWIGSNAPAHLIARHIFVPTHFWPTLRDDVLPKTSDLNEIFRRIRQGIGERQAIHFVEGETPGDRADDLNLGRVPGSRGATQVKNSPSSKDESES